MSKGRAAWCGVVRPGAVQRGAGIRDVQGTRGVAWRGAARRRAAIHEHRDDFS
jgi:hypothetical protein